MHVGPLPPVICGRLQTCIVALLAVHGSLTVTQIRDALARGKNIPVVDLTPMLRRKIITVARARIEVPHRDSIILALNAAHPSYRQIVAFGRVLASRLPIAKRPRPRTKHVVFEHAWEHVRSPDDQFFGSMPKSNCIMMAGACGLVSVPAVVNVVPRLYRQNIDTIAKRYMAWGVINRAECRTFKVLMIEQRWFAARELIRLVHSLAEHAYPEFRGRVAAAIRDDRARGLRDDAGKWIAPLARA